MSPSLFFICACLNFLILAIPAPLGQAQEQIRDIFEPVVVKAAEIERKVSKMKFEAIKVALQGIITSDQGAFAVINGDVFREGEQKDGIKVVHIQKNTVDILIHGDAQSIQMVLVDGDAHILTEDELRKLSSG